MLIPSGSLDGLTKSVPPKLLAHVFLSSFTSTMMIRPALFATAPCTTLRPTQPAPKTAMFEPSSTFAVIRAAPYPVVMPQPRRQVFSIGASCCTATTEISATTVYCEKVEQPMKWRRSLPLHLKRVVPSGICPLPWVARIFPHRFVLPDLQNLHSLHSGVLQMPSQCLNPDRSVIGDRGGASRSCVRGRVRRTSREKSARPHSL